MFAPPQTLREWEEDVAVLGAQQHGTFWEVKPACIGAWAFFYLATGLYKKDWESHIGYRRSLLKVCLQEVERSGDLAPLACPLEPEVLSDDGA